MKIYKIKTKLHAHSWWDGEPRPKPFIENELFIIDDKDDINEFIQMAYGCWYDIKVLKIEEIEENKVHLSTRLMKTHASEVLRKAGL
jgi:hypothetical protein